LLLISSCRGFVVSEKRTRSICGPVLARRPTSAELIFSAAILSTSLFTAPSYADSASDTVSNAIQQLKDSSGDATKTFQAYENVAAIITEGAGVGGAVNAAGVQLERGYVADEDTTIYNPGLALLTETEKTKLVQAVIDARKSATDWNEDNELGFQFLREKLDPYHTIELGEYLKVMPFWSGIVYLGTLAIQQKSRDLFPIAYFLGVALVVGPAVGLVLAGP